MSVTLKGWKRQFMASLFKQEATYDAGVTMSDANACSLLNYDLTTTWDDKIETDKGEVSGKEHGYDQEILSSGCKMTYKEPKCKPNSLAGFATLVLGSDTPTKDGAFAAWKHHIVPITIGNALLSMQVEELFGDLQYKYSGLKGESLKLTGNAGGYLQMETVLHGSGTRSTSATAMAAAISESWMKLSDCKVWMESGADIEIAATLVQAAANISKSPATADNIYPRIKSFDWQWNNNLDPQSGFGGGGVLQDLDYKRRSCALKFTLLFGGAAELAYFTAQTPCAIEFDLKGALIAAGGAMYYGAQLIVPRFKLKTPPLPKGGVNDTLTADFECEVFDDGTNPASILEVYTGKAAYLAA